MKGDEQHGRNEKHRAGEPVRHGEGGCKSMFSMIMAITAIFLAGISIGMTIASGLTAHQQAEPMHTGT